MATNQQQILKKLTRIEKEVRTIKEHMADIDSIMTEDDYQTLLAYRQEKGAGTLVSHERLKRDLAE